MELAKSPNSGQTLTTVFKGFNDDDVNIAKTMVRLHKIGTIYATVSFHDNAIGIMYH